MKLQNFRPNYRRFRWTDISLVAHERTFRPSLKQPRKTRATTGTAKNSNILAKIGNNKSRSTTKIFSGECPKSNSRLARQGISMQIPVHLASSHLPDSCILQHLLVNNPCYKRKLRPDLCNPPLLTPPIIHQILRQTTLFCRKHRTCQDWIRCFWILNTHFYNECKERLQKK